MKNDNWSLALKIMANVSGWIAFPVLIGLFLGQWLDNKFNTTPWMLMGTLALCFTVSIFGMVTTSIKEFSTIEKEAREHKALADIHKKETK